MKGRIGIICLFAILLGSCREHVPNPNTELTLSYYDGLRQREEHITGFKVKEALDSMIRNDNDSMLVDRRVKGYYLRHRPFVWIDRKGVDSRADTLLAHLQEVDSIGFSEVKFRMPQIRRDLQRMRSLDFDKHNTAGKVVARLEYNLTKAYLRYVCGQRFGFVNPTDVFNRLDLKNTDSQAQDYRTLFDLKMEHPGRAFFQQALRAVQPDSLSTFLSSVSPTDPLYLSLRRAYLDKTMRRKYGARHLLINMERCRWRLSDYPHAHRRFVLVNIPAYHLWAVNGDESLTMRVASGSLETKTPLLSSYIYCMDVNPQWIIPKSIVKKSIAYRLSAGYFRSKHYFIRERATGRDVPVSQCNRAMLESGDYLVIQEGGEGNALGRIIFRFNNDFSIYLHDTSSRGVFQQEDRGVSHGCVRVEHPYELALFLLGDDQGKTVEKIAYSMQADVSSLGKAAEELTNQQRAVADTLKRDMLVGRVKVEPKVPIFITYFTLWPAADGSLQRYDDVYGYDQVMAAWLANYWKENTTL